MREMIFSICIILIFVTNAFCAPTYKSCGNPSQSSFCSNASCRTDFDPNVVVPKCEMDFDSPMPVNGHMTCSVSNESKVAWFMAADGSSITFTPKPPLTSLAGLSVYHVCKVAIVQDR